MNKLREPKVLIGIGVAILAFAVLAYVLYGPKPRKSRQATPPASRPPAATTTKAQPNQATNFLWPDTPIDLDKVQASLPQWLDAPQRDPFQLLKPVVSTKPTYSPVSQLKLNAIWRQSGGSAAVINGRLVEQGDTIEGLLLERIEADRVWLKGSEKTEALIFGQVPVAPPPPVRSGLHGIFGPELTPARASTPPKKTKL
jgi:hypothetical protein